MLSLLILFLCLVSTLADNQKTFDGLTAEEIQTGLDICGNYCGPSWCAARKITETNCVQQGVWGMAANGCADACCKAHDYCCGKGTNRPACNAAIVNCIANSGCYTTVCGAVVWAALKAVSTWCCGGPCPSYLINELETTLNMTGQLAAAIKTLHP